MQENKKLSLLNKVMDTESDIALGIFRIGIGIIAIAHAIDNVVPGLFKGKTMGVEYYSGMGIPPFLSWGLLIMILFSASCLMGGLLTRLASLALIFNALLEILLMPLYKNYFMIWEMAIGRREVEGIQFHLLLLTSYSVLALKGAGAFSLDQFFLDEVDWGHLGVLWKNVKEGFARE